MVLPFLKPNGRDKFRFDNLHLWCKLLIIPHSRYFYGNFRINLNNSIARLDLMKLKFSIIILSAVVLIWACVPKPVSTPGPYQVTGEDELFARAEKLYESESYDEALALYDEYSKRFSDKPLAAAALMKIGIIRALKQDYEGARDAFRSILSAYPASPFVPDAMVEELFTYYQQERYRDVIQLAPDILKNIDSRPHIFRI